MGYDDGIEGKSSGGKIRKKRGTGRDGENVHCLVRTFSRFYGTWC